jgi:hypothetical protein
MVDVRKMQRSGEGGGTMAVAAADNKSNDNSWRAMGQPNNNEQGANDGI